MPDPAALKVGDVAPDVDLKTLDGKPFKLSALKNRVIVLVFGSYSSPVFRQRVPALEQLRKDVGQRAGVWIIYTKEAHAVGEWETERNRDEGVMVEQPTTDAKRKALAEQMRDVLKISTPIVLDSMENTIAGAYGLVPNGAVVIGRDGKIVVLQKWFDPSGLKRHVDQASRVSTTQRAS